MTDKKSNMKNAAPADCVTEIRIGNSVLVVSGFFKKDSAVTAADKMAKVIEAEALNGEHDKPDIEKSAV